MTSQLRHFEMPKPEFSDAADSRRIGLMHLRASDTFRHRLDSVQDAWGLIEEKLPTFESVGSVDRVVKVSDFLRMSDELGLDSDRDLALIEWATELRQL